MPTAASGGGGAVCPGKKTAETIQKEIAREINQVLHIILSARRKAGHFDLEAMEMAVRSAMHRVGAVALTELLQFAVPGADQRTTPCSCGHSAPYRELRSKPVLTAVGKVEISRPYYLCPHCHTGQFPADVELDIENTEFSPGVRRMQALVGQEAPFDHGRQQMKLLADLDVTTKAVERTAEAIGEDIAAREQEEIQRAMQLDLPVVVGEAISILYVQMDGTGVPVVKKETVGRKGKSEGQPAHTREAKLGCVFTQTTWDKEGYAIRDPDSTTYVAAIEPSEDFGKRLYLEAGKRGWSRAVKKVAMGDGSEWIWNIFDQHFPGAIQVVDLYHARQHLWDLARKLYPNQEAEQRRWMMIHQDMLDEGKIEGLVAALRAIDSSSPELAERIRIEAGYFENNAKRMRYPEFRRQHLFVGTGVIEAGCKTVIGSRCKQSGMFWTVRGANAILALRCCENNGRFEDYWEARRA
ncbi:MAG TPA: ISKra4 family transposase [Bryobacteraceae bacterium]|nr:ISKra4 family transposase [Bryobacteraceae bacterium]